LSKANSNKIDEVVNIYFRAYEQQLLALRNSARWRIGHACVKIIERIIGRKPRTLALDHMEHMTRAFIQKQQALSTGSDNAELAIRNALQLDHLKATSHGFSTCGIIVSNRNWETAPQGDIFTALELAEASTRFNQWTCHLIDRHDLNSREFDIVISMLHEFDVRKVATVGIKIAWIRSYAEFWIMKPWFEQFEIILCSSQKILNFIKLASDKPAYLFPIATNPERFRTIEANDIYQSDYCFTGNKWHEERRIEQWLAPEELNYTFKIFGRGWQSHNKLKPYHGGQLGYPEIPKVYAASKLILDDSNQSTTKWESVNSRVFDVLGMGKMLLTNNTKAVQELFHHAIPTFDSEKELKIKITQLLNPETEQQELFGYLQEEVLNHHTYKHRARMLDGILECNYGKKLSISIKISVNDPAHVESWGDYHFARGLKKALEPWGHKVRIDLFQDWYSNSEKDDVVVVLRGLRHFQPRADNKKYILWIISHPEHIETTELDAYDHIFVASQTYPSELEKKTNTPVSTLLQCTDPSLFFPSKSNVVPHYSRLYIANSRNQMRLAVGYAKELNLSLDIVGKNWQNIAPTEWIKGEYLPNKILRYYYSNADVVINDHWPEMAKHGFISNRIFDVLACGGFVLTDEIAGLEIFSELQIKTYRNLSEFEKSIRDTNRKTLSTHQLQIIKEFRQEHSFDRRAVTILDVVHRMMHSQYMLTSTDTRI
jgi:spore maturation protein CgeB